MSTDAPGSLVPHIQVTMYSYDRMTGDVYYDDSVVNNFASSASAIRSFNYPDSGWYCNEVTGLVQYGTDPNRYFEDAYDEYRLGMKMKNISSDTLATIENTHKDARDQMLTAFGYEPQAYDYYLNRDLTQAVSYEVYFDVRQQLDLVAGDTIPGYYLDDANHTLIAVKQDAAETNYKFLFEQNDTGVWELCETETI